MTLLKISLLCLQGTIDFMSKLKISVPSEKFTTTATLLNKDAPKTCVGVSKALPLELPLIHGAMSGNEAFVAMEGPEWKGRMLKLKPENWIVSQLPGDVLYYYSWWGDGKYYKDNEEYSEIAFIYGRYVRATDINWVPAAANLFAHIDEKLEEFAAICQKVRNVTGPVKLRLELA
jgi:hypothetical protein